MRQMVYEWTNTGWRNATNCQLMKIQTQIEENILFKIYQLWKHVCNSFHILTFINYIFSTFLICLISLFYFSNRCLHLECLRIFPLSIISEINKYVTLITNNLQFSWSAFRQSIGNDVSGHFFHFFCFFPGLALRPFWAPRWLFKILQALGCCSRCSISGSEWVPPAPLSWYFHSV